MLWMKLQGYKVVNIVEENLMKKLGSVMFLFVKKKNKKINLNNQFKKESE
jgi:hypothetical protein